MSSQKAPTGSGKTPEMWDVAHALLQVAPSKDFLKLPASEHKAAYIPLSAQVNRQRAHRNAVSIHRRFISFMVPDWSLRQDVEAAGFRTEENTRYGKRLHVHGMDSRQILNRPTNELICRLLTIAKLESEDRQKTKVPKGQR